ncbi:MAG: hypothetical protein JNL52_04850 [Flavobacteriales bacterium]|nr:hypothetical protein [Flavobacteriales bacterium]
MLRTIMILGFWLTTAQQVLVAQQQCKSWDRRHGSTSGAVVVERLSLADGGFAVLAQVQGVGGDVTEAAYGGNDFWLLRFDAAGNKLWDKRYGGPGNEVPSDMSATSDGGFLLVGTTDGDAGGLVSDGPSGLTDWWMIRVDASGVVLWDKRMGSSIADQLDQVATLPDGRFFLAGRLRGVFAGSSSNCLYLRTFLLDQSGTVINNRCWPSLNTAQVVELIAEPNGDCTMFHGPGINLSRFDASGIGLITQQNTYTAPGVLQLNAAARTPDGGYYLSSICDGGVGGNKTQPSRGGYDNWVLRITATGMVLWDATIGGAGNDYVWGSTVLASGELQTIGQTFGNASGERTQPSRGGSDLWTMRLGTGGNLVWEARYGGSGGDSGAALHQSPDASLYLIGSSSSNIGGDRSAALLSTGDMWMLKVDGSTATPWYRDADGDGLGDPTFSVLACAAQPGFVQNNSDCNDALVLGSPCNDNDPCTVQDVYNSNCQCVGQSATPITAVEATSNSPVCEGVGIQLGAGSSGTGILSYAWSGPNGFSSTAQNPTIPGATNATAGTYSVTISNGCGSSAASSVAVSVIDPSVSIAYPPGTYCTLYLDHLTPVITGPANGTFTDNSTSLVVAPGSGALYPSISYPGDYVVTYTVAATSGCPQLQASTPVTLAPAPSAEFSYAGGTNMICSRSPGPFLPGGSFTPGGVFSGSFGTTGVDPVTGELSFDPVSQDTLTYWVNYEVPETPFCSGVDSYLQVTVLPWFTYARDLDGDGFGDPNDVMETCDPLPAGYALQAGDYCPLDPLKTEPGACGCGAPEPGTSCDDGDPLTHDDVITAACTCAGTVIEPLCKQWSIVLGSNGSDEPQNVVPAADGGFLVTGRSNGGVGGDRSQDSRGSYDYWVVKVSASGEKQWDKRYGGTSEEYQDGAVATADGGFLVGGFTFSSSGGDITQGTFGNTDFWVVRLDADGNALWNRRYGGSDLDKMTAVVATPDGGFLLGGYTWSSSSGDMNGINRGGMDYAVMKINASGVRLWTRMVGSSGQDYLYDVQLATDGSIYLIGESNGPVSGDKSQASFGGIDTWIVKLNASGTFIWDRSFGGSGADTPMNTRATITPDGGLLFVSRSTSGISGNRTAPQQGFSDAWTVRVSSSGAKLWDRSMGAVSNIWLEDMVLAPGGGCYIGSREVLEEEVVDQGMNNAGLYDSYLLRTDFNGQLLWDKGVPINASLRGMLRAPNGLAILGEGTNGYPDATNFTGQTGANYVLTYLAQGQDVQVWLDEDQDGHGGSPQGPWQRRCGEIAGWSLLNDDCDDLLDTVYPGAPCDDGDPTTLNDQYDTNCMCAGSDVVLLLNMRVLLSGPYNSSTGLMSDALRVAGLVPFVEPYTQLGHSFVGGGGETAQSIALSMVGADAIVDWVVIELRSAQAPATVVFSRSALLQRDGDVVDVDGGSAVQLLAAPGNYYIVVRHRNHLGVATATPIALTQSGTSVDLTSVSTATYGVDAQAIVNGMRMLWPGDSDHNGIVRYTGGVNDRDPVLTAIGGVIPTSTVTNAYHVGDLNLDGVIRYTGANNDRDIILQTIGGSVPTAVRVGQMP